jgi:outer membrane protein OmpA-like peptidoglycan-associated protein
MIGFWLAYQQNFVYGQGQVSDSCAVFVECVKQKRFVNAYSIMMMKDLNHCHSASVDSSRAVVLAALGQTELALKLADSLMALPEAGQVYSDLQKRIAGIMRKRRGDQMAEVLPYMGSNNQKEVLLAYVENNTPVLLAHREGHVRYFPSLQKETGTYALQTNLTSQEASPDIEAIDAWQAEEIGPIAKLSDGKQVVSALFERPYALRKARQKLYLFDPARPEAKPKALPFCRKAYHYMHPSYSAAEGVMVYSSDVAGGEGGMDLWKVKYEGGNWGESENLGPHVNTPYDELFPYAAGDSLYFASNRPDMGLGGVDIYYTRQLQLEPVYVDAPVNSAYDDFGLLINPDGKAYFVSNRPGRGAGDQIYHFNWESNRHFFEKVRGQLLGVNDLNGVKVHLTNLEGDTLQSSALSEKGFFSLSNVRGVRAYMLLVDNPNEERGLLEMRLSDQTGQIIKLLRGDRSGPFLFELLSPEDYYLERIPMEDHSILDIDIIGRYLNPEGTPKEQTKIVLQNSIGEDIAVAFTNEQGQFKFESVQPDERYTLLANGVRFGEVIHVVDGSGKVLQTIQPDQAGNFVYVKIDPGVKSITLTNELSQKVVVNEGSDFNLSKVYFMINSAVLEKNSENELKKLVKILENNPFIRLEISGHTSSRGSESHNLSLSTKRVQAAIDFLEANGIDPKRLSGKGYGESQLLNHCSDGVACSEDQHAQNRRTEFKIFGINLTPTE